MIIWSNSFDMNHSCIHVNFGRVVQLNFMLLVSEGDLGREEESKSIEGEIGSSLVSGFICCFKNILAYSKMLQLILLLQKDKI